MDNLEDKENHRVSYNQLEELCEFLNSHRDIAVGYNKSSQARDYSRRQWQTVAQILNSMGEGAIKNWKGWSTYWVNYKAKLKRKNASIRNSRRQTGGGPSTELSLTEVERRFLQIMGEDFGTGLPGVRVDPFENTVDRAQDGGSEYAELGQNQLEQPTPSTASLATPILIVVGPEEDAFQFPHSISILDPLHHVDEQIQDVNRVIGDDDSGPVEAWDSNLTTVDSVGGSHTVEPRAGGSQTVKPCAGASRTVEPRASGSRTVKPSAGASRTIEPRASGSRTVEPRAGGSHTVEPSPGASRTVEPSASGSHTVEPRVGASRTVEPRAGGSHTVEPSGSGSRTVEPRAGASRTVESRADGAGAYELRAGSPGEEERRASGTGRTPGVQRRRRRVFTAEAARRMLLESSDRRADIERSNSQSLVRLINVLEGIHGTLRRIEASALSHGAGAAPTNAERDRDV